jgi:site-specific DNA-methyltransferase (adenine-specific)
MIAHHGNNSDKLAGIFSDYKPMKEDTIENRDCVEGMQEIPTESVDLVVTDCPYMLVGGGCSDGNYKTAKGHSQTSGVLNRQRTKHVTLSGALNDQVEAVRAGKMFEHNEIKFSEWLPDVYRVLKPDTHCYIMINSRNLKELWTEAEKVGFKFQNLLVWRKNSATPNKFYMQQLEFILMLRKGGERWINDMGITNCLSTPNIIGNKNHPTEKPVALMRIMIEQSTQKGDLVLDPFMGAGSTALACVQAERHFIGFEIDEQYYDIAQRRLKGESRQLSLFN